MTDGVAIFTIFTYYLHYCAVGAIVGYYPREPRRDWKVWTANWSHQVRMD